MSIQLNQCRFKKKHFLYETEQFVVCPNCFSLPLDHYYLFRARINRAGWKSEKYCRIRLCKLCGFVFVSPRPEMIVYEDFYRYSNYLEENCKTIGIKRSSKTDAIVDFICMNLETEANFLDVLDLGCGFGETLAAFREKVRCRRVVGVEISEIATKYLTNELKIDIIRANVEEFPQMNGAFDVVIVAAVLEHLLNPRDFMKYIKSLLKDDGTIFISVPDLRSLHFKLLKRHLNKVFKPVHTCYFDEITLGSMLAREGLVVVDQKQVYTHPSAAQGELWVVAKIMKDQVPQNIGGDEWKRTASFLWKKCAAAWLFSEGVEMIRLILGERAIKSLKKHFL